MKVVGIVEPGEKYLAEVSHTELEKFTNQYYGKLKGVVRVGSELDLGKGYDFLRETRAVCQSVKDVVEKGSAFVKTLSEGICLLAEDGGKKE